VDRVSIYVCLLQSYDKDRLAAAATTAILDGDDSAAAGPDIGSKIWRLASEKGSERLEVMRLGQHYFPGGL